MRGELVSASQCFEKALSLQPDSAEAHCGLGLVFLDRKRIGDGVDQLNEAIRCDPNGKAHLLLGKVLAAGNDHEVAVSHLEEAAQLAPNDAAAWYDARPRASRQGRLADAAECHARALKLRPGSETYRRGMTAVVDALEKAGQTELAQSFKQRMPASGTPTGAERGRSATPTEND